MYLLKRETVNVLLSLYGNNGLEVLPEGAGRVFNQEGIIRGHGYTCLRGYVVNGIDHPISSL
jgi:hypothetical protein